LTRCSIVRAWSRSGDQLAYLRSMAPLADEQGETLRRHVPRLGAGDPLRRGPVTLFLGGGHALSAPMLRQIGDWPACFFFEHEESDLAWRALDAGWDIWCPGT
jgi:GT2 family glycosyltransferase